MGDGHYYERVAKESHDCGNKTKSQSKTDPQYLYNIMANFSILQIFKCKAHYTPLLRESFWLKAKENGRTTAKKEVLKGKHECKWILRKGADTLVRIKNILN